ncbi:hypothetical protein TNCV_324451 [Trichonephila clavipes]|nr:hypothetical protein TNCV_324451 [Trichonephila clavipes]
MYHDQEERMDSRQNRSVPSTAIRKIPSGESILLCVSKNKRGFINCSSMSRCHRCFTPGRQRRICSTP